jgi:WD40 repeat protein
MFLLAAAALFILLPGCDNTIELQFTNPYDPGSPTYVPNAPDQLSAFVEGDSTTYLTWDDNSMNEDGFVIELMIGLSGDFIPIDTVAQGVTEYHHRHTLEQNLEYNYRVAAYKENRLSKRTNIHSIKFYMSVPGQPAITFISATSCKVQMSYSGFFKQYRLERSVNGGSYALLAMVGQDKTFYLDETVDTLNTYSYRCKVTTGRNESVYSPVISMEYSFSDAEVIASFDLGQPVHSITFSPNGSMIAAAGFSNALRVWDLASRTLKQDLNYTGAGQPANTWPYQCVFNSDGTLLASHSELLSGKGIRVWNTATGAVVKDLGLTGRSFAFSADSKELYVGGLTGGISIWNIAGNSSSFEWTAHGGNNAVNFVHTINNGTRLITGSYGSAEFLRTWNLGTIGSQQNFSGYNYEFYALSADETKLSAGQSIRDLNSGNLIRTFSASITGQTCFNYSNTHLIEKRYDGRITVYSVAGGSQVWTKALTRASIITFPAVAGSPNTPMFATASATVNMVDVWMMKYAWRSF